MLTKDRRENRHIHDQEVGRKDGLISCNIESLLI